MAKKKQSAKGKHLQRLDELIAEGTVDCYNDEEAHAGMAVSAMDAVECPFKAMVLGEEVEVIALEQPRQGDGVYAICRRNGKKYNIDVNSLEWVKPYPKGFEWIEAYLYFRHGIEDLTGEND